MAIHNQSQQAISYKSQLVNNMLRKILTIQLIKNKQIKQSIKN